MKRLILRSCLYLVAILIIAAACLPSLLSMKKGQQFLTQQLSKALDAKVELEDLQLSWLSPQTLHSLDIEKSDQYHFHLDKFQASAPLWKLLIPGASWGSFTFENPILECEIPASSAATPATTSTDSSSPTDLSALFKQKLHLEVTGARLTCVSPQGMSQLEQLSISAHLDGLNAPAKLLLEGHTTQKGDVGVIGISIDVSDPKELLSSINAELKLENFPLEVAYPWLASPYAQLLDHWDHQATLDLSVVAQRQAREGNYTLSFKSKPLQAHLEMKESDGQISLVQPADLSLTLTAKELQLLSALSSNLPQMTSDLKAGLKLSTLDFDMANPQEVEFDIDLQLNEIQLMRQNQRGSIAPLHVGIKRHGSTMIEMSSPATQGMNYRASAKLDGAPNSLSLTSLTLGLDKIKRSDLELWTSLPPIDLKWAFPLALSVEVKQGDEGYDFTSLLSSALSKVQLEGSTRDDELNVKQLQVQLPALSHGDIFVDAATLQASHISCQLSDPLSTLTGEFALSSNAIHYQKLVFEPIDCAIKANKGSIDCSLNSTSFNAKASIAAKKEQIQLQKPLEFNLNLTLPQLESLLGKLPLVKPIQLQLSAAPFAWNFSEPLSSLKLKLAGKLAGLVVAAPGPSTLNLPDLVAQISCDGALHQLVADLQTTPAASSNSGSSEVGKISLHAICTDQQLESATLKLSQVPSKWLDVFSGNTPWASTLLGPQIDTEANLQIASKLISIDLDLTTKQLQSRTSWKQLATGCWKLDKPGSLQMTVTPDGYETIKGWIPAQGDAKTINLTDPIQLKIALDSLEILSLQQPLSSTKAHATLSIDNLSLLNRDAATLSQFKNGKFELDYDQGKTLAIKASAATACESSEKGKKQRQEGALSLSAKLQEFMSLNQGVEQITPDKALLELDATCTAFGTDLLDLATRGTAQGSDLLGQLLGPKFDFKLQTQLNNLTGPLLLDLKSQLTTASIKGKLQKGTLTLDQPLKAQIQVTKELANSLLKGNESVITGFYSEAPVKLEISDKHFSLPLMPFDRDKIQIDKLHLELGKVQCANKGALSTALGLLKWKQDDKDNNLHLWFNPIDLSMKQGVLNLQRIDLFAAAAFPIAIWGVVDFPKDHVDIQLGITRDAFISAFGMDELPEDYMMLLPIQGTLATANIDKASATTKITTLLAWHAKSAVSVLSFTPAGFVADQLIKAVVTHKSSTPIPPSPYPIPWKIAVKKSPTTDLLKSLDKQSQESAQSDT